MEILLPNGERGCRSQARLRSLLSANCSFVPGRQQDEYYPLVEGASAAVLGNASTVKEYPLVTDFLPAVIGFLQAWGALSRTPPGLVTYL